MSITLDLNHLPTHLLGKALAHSQQLAAQGRSFLTIIDSQPLSAPANTVPIMTARATGSKDDSYICKLAHDAQMRLWGECNCSAHLSDPYPQLCYHLVWLAHKYDSATALAVQLALAS